MKRTETVRFVRAGLPSSWRNARRPSGPHNQPSVERQIRVTPYPTEDVGWITEQVGPEICLFSTDYPHVEGGRKPYERFERSLGDASEATRDRFYARNFVDLMGDALPPELRG